MHRISLLALVVVFVAGVAAAQQPPAQPGTPPTPAQRLRVGNFEMKGNLVEQSEGGFTLTGDAELTVGADARIFADRIVLNVEASTLKADGNVVLRNSEGTISAARIEFDIEKGTGIFHTAAGVMSLGANADPLQFGGQDPDVYFHGDIIERVSSSRYRITRGAFTTCVQPEPRWEMTSGTVEISLNDHAIARNTVLRIKGVPVLYLPIVYYPIRDDERATGFLLPTAGGSRIRGRSISNGFFWAIGRSHDLTVGHDWFSKAGQGVGAEYRYIAGQQSFGNVRLQRFYQKDATYETDAGSQTIDAGTSFELTGSAVQTLTPSLRARGRVDYASNIFNQQLYQQSLLRSSNPVRAIEGSITGSFNALSTNLSYQRTEVFRDEERSILYGSTPRITGALAPQRLFGKPIYGSLSGEFVHLPYQEINLGKVTRDKSVSRIDFNPTVRIPLSSLSFLTVNSNAAFRSTYYSRSATTLDGPLVPEPMTRSYLSVRSDIVGPVFNRIWDTPESERSERRKHVIEPNFSIDYVSPIESFSRVPVLSDYTDVVVGATTRMTYGVTNRLFSRARSTTGGRGQAREVLTIGVQQTYYSNPEAGRFDSSYQTAFSYQRPLTLSPIALTARLNPSSGVQSNSRLEFDVAGNGLQMVSVGGGAQGERGSVTANLSWRHLDKTRTPDNYVSTSSSIRLADGRINGTYGLSWDIGRSYIVSQTLTWSHMAQCCGFQVEFQQYNYPDSLGLALPSDQRINFGFVLAGLGTFSNFFGAFGGQ